MNFGQAIGSGLRNYVNFSGRTPRSGYWYWVLFSIIVTIPASIIDTVLFADSDLSPINTIVSLALFLPSLAIGFRRLHDIDRTAWWTLLVFTGIGFLLLLYWACVRGTTGPNRFGADPFEGADRW